MLGCKNGRVISADEKIFEVIIELSIPSLREVCFIDTFTPPNNSLSFYCYLPKNLPGYYSIYTGYL